MPKAGFTPEDGGAEHPLGMVVGGCHPLMKEKGPEGGFLLVQIPAEGARSSRKGAAPGKQRVKLLLDREHCFLQTRPIPPSGAEGVPVGKERAELVLFPEAHGDGGPAAFCQGLEVTGKRGPTELPAGERQAGVDAEAVAGDDAGRRKGEQRLKSGAVAAVVKTEEGEGRRCRQPEPGPLPCFLPARLIGVKARCLGHRLRPFFIRKEQGGGGVRFQGGQGAQREGEPKGILEQFQGGAAPQAEAAGEEGAEGLQARPHHARGHLRRQRSPGARPAPETGAGVELMLGHMGCTGGNSQT